MLLLPGGRRRSLGNRDNTAVVRVDNGDTGCLARGRVRAHGGRAKHAHRVGVVVVLLFHGGEGISMGSIHAVEQLLVVAVVVAVMGTTH